VRRPLGRAHPHAATRQRPPRRAQRAQGRGAV
jgi:hypothetical protein